MLIEEVGILGIASVSERCKCHDDRHFSPTRRAPAGTPMSEQWDVCMICKVGVTIRYRQLRHPHFQDITPSPLHVVAGLNCDYLLAIAALASHALLGRKSSIHFRSSA